jgi:hypothetical protein
LSTTSACRANFNTARDISFVSAVRAEPVQAILINDNGAALAGGRIWIAPVCITDSCVEHRAGIISINMF